MMGYDALICCVFIKKVIYVLCCSEFSEARSIMMLLYCLRLLSAFSVYFLTQFLLLNTMFIREKSKTFPWSLIEVFQILFFYSPFSKEKLMATLLIARELIEVFHFLSFIQVLIFYSKNNHLNNQI